MQRDFWDWKSAGDLRKRVPTRVVWFAERPTRASGPSSNGSASKWSKGISIDTVDQAGQLALVDAARTTGVEHFVFVSFRENPKIQYPLIAAKRAVEQALKKSGMAFTILQASYFMEIWLSPALGFDIANGKVRMYGDGGHAISWISYRDVARVAVASVTQPVARNMVVELGGPQALSQREVIRMLEAAGAGEIATESIPESALEAQMNAATDPLQKSFAGRCFNAPAAMQSTSRPAVGYSRFR